MVIPSEVLFEKKFTGFVSKDFHDYLTIIKNPDYQLFLDRYETSIVQELPAEYDSRFQQIIPYIVVKHNGKIFVYERAPPGVNTEERLASKLSVGVGGHIEPFDDDDDDLILATVKREMQEELGYLGEFYVTHKGYINFEESDVDKVHFGVVFVTELKEHEFVFCNDEIVHGSFRTIEELRSHEVYNRLENWSRVIVDYIHMVL